MFIFYDTYMDIEKKFPVPPPPESDEHDQKDDLDSEKNVEADLAPQEPGQEQEQEKSHEFDMDGTIKQVEHFISRDHFNVKQISGAIRVLEGVFPEGVQMKRTFETLAEDDIRPLLQDFTQLELTLQDVKKVPEIDQIRALSEDMDKLAVRAKETVAKAVQTIQRIQRWADESIRAKMLRPNVGQEIFSGTGKLKTGLQKFLEENIVFPQKYIRQMEDAVSKKK